MSNKSFSDIPGYFCFTDSKTNKPTYILYSQIASIEAANPLHGNGTVLITPSGRRYLIYEPIEEVAEAIARHANKRSTPHDISNQTT